MDCRAAASGYLEKIRNACRAENDRPWEVYEERKAALTKEFQAEPGEVQMAFVRLALATAAELAPGPSTPEITGLMRIIAGLTGRRETHRRFNWMEFNLLGALVSGALRRKLPFPAHELAAFVRSWAEQLRRINHYFSLPSLLGAVEAAERTPEMEAAMRGLKTAYAIAIKSSSTRETRALQERIERYLVPESERKLIAGGPWSSAVLAETEEMPEADRNLWHEIFHHCLAAQSASVPSMTWRKKAEELIQGLGADKVRQCALRWLDPQTTPLTANAGEVVKDKDADYLKGFVWLLAGLTDGNLCRAVADCGLACLRKIPNHGPVSARAGFACVNVLAEMPGMEPVSQLTRLRVKVKYAVALKLIEKALNAAAERAGLARDDLEDMAVPDFSLDADGRRLEKLGDCEAELKLLSPDEVELVWKNAAGKPVKSPPAEVRQNHAARLKELKRAATDLQKMSMAQRLRIEQFFIHERSIGYPHWRRYFIGHPLMGAIARRLIWSFETDGKQTQGIWLNGDIVDWNNRPLTGLNPQTTVRLWHPLQSDQQTILSWRCLLEDQRIVQPFKQAHREIYILTPAEEQTATYSNRFAAHVIRQHQFAGLCRERGWRYHLMGMGFDGHNVPTLEVPRRAISAEFWVDTPGQGTGTDPRYATDQMTGSGINLYLITDQVRFYREGARLPLAEISPVVFSEIMRDVDLFVGVTSIGNDPQWLDQGANAHGQYWREFAFGELGQSGETRRAVLERLLPQLKIAAQCSLEGRYLIVRGDLHTYKIHLGSSNVLMEPGSRYLCIVPGRGQGWERGPLYLPFEGDQTLAIILSKAFLLAADKKITDTQILAQMKRPGISIQ